MPIDGAGRKGQSRSQSVADSSDDTQLDETIEPERPSGTDHSSLSAKHAERGDDPPAFDAGLNEDVFLRDDPADEAADLRGGGRLVRVAVLGLVALAGVVVGAGWLFQNTPT